MLPWVNRIFRSHYLPKTRPACYGIPEPMAESFVGQLVQLLREPGTDAEPAAQRVRAEIAGSRAQPGPANRLSITRV